MNQRFMNILYKWPKPYISGTDLSFLLGGSSDSRYAITKRAVQEQQLVPLRRDLYLVKNRPENSLPDAFELASIVYGPSYVSLESALNFHGWIPEAVITVTSACSKRNKTFETPIGVFSYHSIPISVFSLGIGQYSRKGVTLFIAKPWKALADYIYVKKKSWPSLSDLSDDLRIELDTLENSDKELLAELVQTYPNARVRKALAIFLKELNS